MRKENAEGEMRKSDRLRSSRYTGSKKPSSTVVQTLSGSSDDVFIYIILRFF